MTAGSTPAISGRRPRLGREVLLLLGLFAVYRLGRLMITGRDDLALANAARVWTFERALALPNEERLQDVALQWPGLLEAANWYYVTLHFPVTFAFLAWGWYRRPAAEYRWARRLVITVTAFALLLHAVMPLAPPRMMASLGFLDTMAVFGPSAYGESPGGLANQFAAMPSLHVGWALLVAVVVVRTARSRWRWLVVGHPAATVAVVVLTGNHYWLDAVVAALLVGVALLVTPRPSSVPAAALWPRLPERFRTGRDGPGPQTIRTRSTGVLVGREDPSAGSTVTPTTSPGATPRTSPVSSPPRPRTPAEADSEPRIRQSW